MRRAPFLPVAFLLLLASPAWAVKEWYDHYLEARDKHLPAKRYEEALKSLQEAVRLKPNPAIQEQTYGLQFLDYLPYYHMGVAYLRLGDYGSAIRMFNIEEDRQAVKRRGTYAELIRLREEAQDGERQRVARRARAEVNRLIREAESLARGRKFEEALARLAEAQAGAASLDPATQRSVVELRDRVRLEEKELADREGRSRRLEQALSEGRRLLESDRLAEAVVRFDQVLALDPQNAPALAAKQEAEELIRASESRQSLQAAFREGRARFDAGRYDEALKPLAVAAADPGNTAARDLLERARSTLEGMRQQKELRASVDRLLAEGERLLGERLFADAQVRFESVLQLDPGNVKARERLTFAERKTGETILDRWLPNQSPILTFFAPRETDSEILAPTIALVGVATDDRGIARVQFRRGDSVLAEITPPLDLTGGGDSGRNVRLERELPLERGPNEITVVATDTGGLSKAETFRLTRRLRIHEEAWFLPSAGATALGLVGAGLLVQRVRRARAVRSRFNPYIAGAPVLDQAMFFGREKLMARILNVLHHNSLMITGERRIGKTTFLYHLKKALETDEGTEYKFFPVFTDLQGVPESAFFHTVMADVVESLGLSPATLEGLRFRSDRTEYEGRDFAHDLQRVIEELKTRTPRRVKLALLIDEVDALNEYSERINQRLRSIFMKTFSEHLVAIMSGVGVKRIWKSEGSPWYNFFDEIELTSFSREEAEALVRRPVEGFFRYEAEAVERILEESQMKPYVVQKFCIHAVNRMLEEGRTTVTIGDVEAVRDAVRIDREPEGAPARQPVTA